jgi:hypothetical protein
VFGLVILVGPLLLPQGLINPALITALRRMGQSLAGTLRSTAAHESRP